jgi:hypothetical protein
MIKHRVIGTAKETSFGGGAHPHVARLCLDNGQRVTKQDAINRIRLGTASNYTLVGGLRAAVRVVDRCARCSSAYLRTEPDATLRNNLLELPDC